MAIVLTSRPSKKSKLRRIAFLPRVSVTIDVAGKQFGLFHVPLIETIVNMMGREFNLQNFISVTHEQIRELDLPSNTQPSKKPRTKKSR